MGRAAGRPQLVADRCWHDYMQPAVFLKAKTGVFLMRGVTAYMVHLSEIVRLYILHEIVGQMTACKTRSPGRTGNGVYGTAVRDRSLVSHDWTKVLIR